MNLIAKKILVLICVVLMIGFAFVAGLHVRKQEYEKVELQQCREYLTSAIDLAENRGLSETGVRESIISYLYAAHECCDSPELSARLNDLQFALTYQVDAYLDNSTDLAEELHDIISAADD